jgi:hypothetical protein
LGLGRNGDRRGGWVREIGGAAAARASRCELAICFDEQKFCLVVLGPLGPKRKLRRLSILPRIKWRSCQKFCLARRCMRAYLPGVLVPQCIYVLCYWKKATTTQLLIRTSICTPPSK